MTHNSHPPSHCRAKFTYGQNWEAVQGYKDKYDPNNFFRNNLNIPPSGNAGACTSSSSKDPAVLGIVIACLVLLVTLFAMNVCTMHRGIQSKTTGPRTSLISQDGPKYSPNVSSLPVETIGGGAPSAL